MSHKPLEQKGKLLNMSEQVKHFEIANCETILMTCLPKKIKIAYGAPLYLLPMIFSAIPENHLLLAADSLLRLQTAGHREAQAAADYCWRLHRE